MLFVLESFQCALPISDSEQLLELSQHSGADTGFLKGGVTKKVAMHNYIVLQSKTGMRSMPILGGLGACPPGNF